MVPRQDGSIGYTLSSYETRNDRLKEGIDAVWSRVSNFLREQAFRARERVDRGDIRLKQKLKHAYHVNLAVKYAYIQVTAPCKIQK